MNHKVIALSCAVGALGVVASADAALIDLLPGAGTAVDGTTVALEPELEGGVPSMGDVSQNFQIFGAGDVLLFEGTLLSRVVISDDTGNAHFYHRITASNGGTANSSGASPWARNWTPNPSTRRWTRVS